MICKYYLGLRSRTHTTIFCCIILLYSNFSHFIAQFCFLIYIEPVHHSQMIFELTVFSTSNIKKNENWKLNYWKRFKLKLYNFTHLQQTSVKKMAICWDSSLMWDNTDITDWNHPVEKVFLIDFEPFHWEETKSKTNWLNQTYERTFQVEQVLKLPGRLLTHK